MGIDLKKYKIMMSLQDADGINIEGNVYKALGGASILLVSKNYPSMSFRSMVNDDSRPGVMINTKDSFLDRFGPAGYSGYERPTLTLNCLIPIKKIASKVDYFGDPANKVLPKYSEDDKVLINYYILFNLWLLNHRYYLKDLSPFEESDNTDLGLPINSMINRKDWLGNDILSEKGLPVIITGFAINSVLLDYDDSDENTSLLEAQIEFVVD